MFVRPDRLLLRPDHQPGGEDALHDGRPGSTLPLVIRTAYGTHGYKRSYGGGARGASTRRPLYAVLAHVPGLKVVVPSTAYNAKGLMLAAIADDGPVVVMELKFLGTAAGAVPEGSSPRVAHRPRRGGAPRHRRDALRHPAHDPSAGRRAPEQYMALKIDVLRSVTYC